MQAQSFLVVPSAHFCVCTCACGQQGVQLEGQYGSAVFAALVGWLTLLSNATHVGLAYVLSTNWWQYR